MKKIIWLFNLLSVFVTLVVYGLQLIRPSEQSFLLGTTIFLPVFLVLNSFFLLYWLIKIDRKFLLSLIVLLLAISWIRGFIVFNKPKLEIGDNNVKSLKIASFNAHYFRRKLKEGKAEFFETEFKKQFLEKQDVDLLLLQEGTIRSYNNLIKKEFLYSSVLKWRNSIYTNYPIVNIGKIDWEEEKNRCVFYDLSIDKDTIRVYNIHLGSYKYPKSSDGLVKRGAKDLFKRLRKVFKTHEEQIDLVVDHIQECPYPVVVCGDFNNLPNAYPYQAITKTLNLKDTFVEAGSGLGATYDFPYFPLRIDYIFVPKEVEVLSHKVIKAENMSDHYPVITEIKL